jgi:hypothetical protein
MKNRSALLGKKCGQPVKSPAVVGYLEWDIRYNSVVTQITYNAELTLTEKSSPPGSKQCRIPYY